MILLASTTEQQFTTPELVGLPEGWWRLLGLVLLGGLGYLIVWLYRREARVGAPAGLRSALASLRCLVIVLLAVVWLEPVIATYTIRTITANVVVLTDVSESMAIVDADTPDTARIARVAGLLGADDHAWLKRMAANNDLLTYTFGERTTRQPLPPDVAVRLDADASAADGGAAATQSLESGWTGAGQAIDPLAATQRHTDIGQALATVVADVGDKPVAGVVVFSDGRFNHGMSADEAAAYARRLRAPLYAVGVGSPREPPNLRFTSFATPATTAKDDPFEVSVELSAAGIGPTMVPLELTARPADTDQTSARVIAAREVSIGGDQPNADVRFRVDADTAGEFLYQARVPALPDEAVELDNRREGSVLVLDERLRVLLIAGHPSYEYRYVTRLLERDKTIDVGCWLQSADAHAVRDGDFAITALPRQPAEIFDYDAVMLMDPDPRELDSAWAITVRRLVDEFGGGLLLQAGPHFTSRFLRDPRLEDLITILPVTPDPDADVRLSEQGAHRTRAYALQIPAEVRGHPLLRMHSEADVNYAIWETLPGVWWYLPVLRAKPLATTLIQHGSPAHATRHGPPVLLAAQPFGAGRTVYLAYENTWRWRSTAEQHFERFWIQLVRYLAQPRRQGASKRGTIVLDRETINPGDYLKIEARVLDAAFAPWHAPEVEAFVELTAGESRALTLKAIPGREGWFAGRLVVDWTGPAVIRVSLPDAADRGKAERALRKHILVEGSDIELRSLGLLAEPLTRLAEQTGGQYVPLDEAVDLPNRIENASQVKTTRGADRPLWDKTWVMVLIAGLLAIEWALRRRSHLL